MDVTFISYTVNIFFLALAVSSHISLRITFLFLILCGILPVVLLVNDYLNMLVKV